MDDDVQISAAAFIILCDAIKKKQRKRRRYWMTNLFKSRNIYSGSNLLNDLSLSRTGQFKNFCRISCEDFEYLIHLIGHKIAKQETTFRQPIPVKERLAVTLRFLATGDSYTSLMYLFKISKQSISTIVTEVCQALCDALKDYVKLPKTENDWKKIAKEFNSEWQFPTCIGAVDGKHIHIVAPKGSGSYYFNYKKRNSIVLMAISNANYEFIMCDIGTNGRVSDGGLNYERRIFNYRLSRARRIIENVFGILVARFRIFHTDINLKLETTEIVTLCCCILHNFLCIKSSNHYIPPESTDQEDIGNATVTPGLASHGVFDELQRTPTNISANAKQTRQQYLEYFNGVGAVEWQDRMIVQRE
ncbi:hypothetical protein PPYR_04710 [Photinus pyralis]|uniref:DDE Tnp4 domain-containing protein n=1 Tax=Photinus pyralis TaxID=7054 RepID=A0A5N4AYW8_PHOPY|nr:hypothetical protein PPYR_04710 [Photinus pyralis]